MKKTQRLTAVFLLLLILCGCSTPTAPDTIVMPQTSAETRTEPAPVSAEPEPGVFHLEYEQTALPEPLSAVTALTVLDGTFRSIRRGQRKKRRTPASGQHGVSLRALPGRGRRGVAALRKPAEGLFRCVRKLPVPFKGAGGQACAGPL